MLGNLSGDGLYVVDVDEPLPASCRVDAWRPDIAGISEVFHARIVGYAYPTHSHDTWTVLIVDDGAISYDLDTRHCGAAGPTVAILPPGVTHNGTPAPGAPGFSKRVLYLDESFLPAELIGPAVDQTNITDHALRQTLVQLHDELVLGADPMHAETSLAMIAERLTQHLETQPSCPEADERGIAIQLRELLDSAIEAPLTLADAAHQLKRSKPHLVRTFSAAYGVSPHAYLIGKRVDAARKLLLDGVPSAQVAPAVGFYDQSHLTRHFKRHTSVPPTAFATSHTLAGRR